MTRVILVTGCSRGVGRALALERASRGWTVVATLRGEAGRAPLEAAGVEVEALDVTDGPAHDALVARVLARHGRLDAVVANAGAGLFGCFEDLDDAEIRALFEVNLLGVMSLLRAALPALRVSRGRVVLISSVAGLMAAPGSSAYSATKFALEGLGESLRHELAPFGVRVVLVEPGPTDTGFFAARGRGARVGQGPYAAITRRLEDLHAQMSAQREPAHVVVQGVARALDGRAPPLRIATGEGVAVQILAKRLLPWPVYEAVARLKLRLPRS
ncbi:MAG: SDR family oxidoreductase [Alphaproteobacteria bacterium]|nr:SDR family oxidoreductase [Alphaproteobacteria bacterium]